MNWKAFGEQAHFAKPERLQPDVHILVQHHPALNVEDIICELLVLTGEDRRLTQGWAETTLQSFAEARLNVGSIGLVL